MHSLPIEESTQDVDISQILNLVIDLSFSTIISFVQVLDPWYIALHCKQHIVNSQYGEIPAKCILQNVLVI